MSRDNGFKPEVPMAVKLDRALRAHAKRSVEEQIDLLVQIGSIPESRRQQAIATMKANLAKQAKRRPRSRRAKPA